MANVNKGNAFIYGATLDLRLSSPNVWAFKANLTYTHGGSVDSHHPLPSISPLFGHLTLRYIVGKSSDFEFSYRFSSSKNPDKYSIGGEDGLEETPVIFDGIDFSFNGMPSWSVSVSSVGIGRVSSMAMLNQSTPGDLPSGAPGR